MREPEWLTLGQAARYLGVAQSTIRKWSDNGRVRVYKTPGRHRRYRLDDLDAFLERSGPEPRRGPVVLIVDDDDRLREYVRVNLELEGYTVREAGSAEEGMRVLDDSRPDLILLDVMMPKISGFEVCKRLRANPVSRDIAVLMITALDQPSDIDRAVEAGTNDFLTKPINKAELLLRVRAALRSRQHKGQLDQALAYIEGVERPEP